MRGYINSPYFIQLQHHIQSQKKQILNFQIKR